MKVRKRLVTLVLFLALNGAVVFLALQSREQGIEAVDVQVRTARWLQEIEQAAAAESCPTSDVEAAREVSKQTLLNLSVWTERERVDAAQTLRSWRSVEGAIKCASLGASHESLSSLEAERARLKLVFSDNLRAWHAAYMRASEADRGEEASRAVRGILTLIAVHPGKLRSDLERRWRQLQRENAGDEEG